MRARPAYPFLCGVIFVQLVSVASHGRAADGIALELPRHAYYRGEQIALTVSATPAVNKGTVELSLGGCAVASAPLQGSSVKIAVPTGDIKVGQYELKATLRAPGREASAVEQVTIARKPASDRLEIWLWGAGGGGTASYYFDHGFTIAGGPSWVYWHDERRADAMKDLDYRLARGVYATIGPCGGIRRGDFKRVTLTGDDTAYKGAGRHEEDIYNPFAADVEAARREANRRFMEALGNHPAIKVAFYNTEQVDHLWLDNLNREGVELTRKTLGFTRDQRGEPNFVAPGVIADDDRGYRFLKYVYKGGNGLAHANQQTAEDVKRFRPDVWTLTDPYRAVAVLDMFPGMDMVGTWTYTSNDPKPMLYVETMRALTRGTRQRPLQIVTLLNYPGTMAPRSLGPSDGNSWGHAKPEHAGWMLTGPDFCKEVSWLILSRAPKIFGYYFSSACNPVACDKPEDQFRVPRATSDAIREMANRVYQPYGQMITRLDVARRRIAVLSSQASRLYGKSPRTLGYPNDQIYGFYTVLAMAHLDGDVLFDEHVEQGALKDYDVLVLPKCDVVTKTMYDEILRFAKRGGRIVADQYLGPEIPGVVRFNFDFTYRNKVNADAIATGVTFAQWDDHLNPNTAELAKARGVTAEEDRKILESYARQLTAGLAGKVRTDVLLDTPRALVNVLENDGVKYLLLVNDNRAYGDRVGKYRAVMEKLVPQTVTVALPGWEGTLHAYDLLERKALSSTRSGDGSRFKVELTELGGKLIALYGVDLAKLVVSVPPTIRRSSPCALSVTIADERGSAVHGLQPLRVTVTDAKGQPTEYSGCYCATGGWLRIPFSPAVNDEPGSWKVAIEDLTAGLTAEKRFEVR